MDSLLEWARGPLFRATFLFMILGLARLVFLSTLDLILAWRRAGDRDIPLGAVLRTTFSWLIPFSNVNHRTFTSIISVLFHISILTGPIFLAGHVLLLKKSLGLSWPVFPDLLSDLLTVLAVLTAGVLVLQRAMARDTRHLSRPRDYLLPLLVALPFLTGWLVMHPAAHPMSHQLAMLFHVLSAELLFVLLPLTKLSHAVLLPETQLVSELAWHWPPDAGSRVAATLGKENEPV